jgi:adenylate cyclase
MAVAALTGLSGGLGAAIGLAAAPGWALLLVGGGVGALLGIALACLGVLVWLPMLLPMAVLPVGAGAAYTARYLFEERSRRQIQHAFSHYLSPTIVNQLAEDPSALKLGGERRDVTVMFADLSGFTALSGKVGPEVLMRLTNEYLGYLVEAVEGTGGYVDKFIGDAVMALWGAPVADSDHAARAIETARQAVARVRAAARAAVQRGEPSFAVKIGLHSGPAVVGNVGTERRYNYTAIGETVNLAARLESVPGIYDCAVVVSARTAALVENRYLLRELDTILVKGGATPLRVFEPVAELEAATPAQFEDVRRYAEALAAYRAGRFTAARQAWEALAAIGEGGREAKCPAASMAARARSFEMEPPPQPWDGVWVLKGK